MTDKIKKDMQELGDKVLKKHSKIEDYELTVDVGLGPRIFFTLKDAEGDVSTARKARKVIGNEIEKILKDTMNGLLSYKMRSVNKGDDLVLEVTILFP